MIYLVSNQSDLYNSVLFIPVSLDTGIELLENIPELSLDSETAGLDPFTKKLLLLQIGTFDVQVLFDIASFEGKIPDKLAMFLNNSQALFLIQNAKFDLKFLFKQGVILKKVYDTMLVEIIITNGLQYAGRDLETLALKYCDAYLDKSIRGVIITKGLNDAVLKYGAEDIKYLSKIKEEQLKEVEELNLKIAVDLDNSFVVVLAYIEYCGIKLDYNKWATKVRKNIDKVAELKQILEAQLLADNKRKYFSGMKDMWTGQYNCILNWDSPKQVLELFKDYGINVVLKIKGESKETVDSKVLEPQIDKFPILKPYLDYKAAQKEVSTYGYNWRNFINPITGRIHTTYQQLMNTGRLSSGNKRDKTPNMQNLPADDETRSCFIPEKNNVMVDADYSGQENIVIANFSKEKRLLDFYKQGFSDLHSYVTFLMYPEIRRCALEELTPENLKYIKEEYSHKRYIAKRASFTIAYGGNGTTIARNCNIPKKDGDFAYKAYFEAFPALKQYFDLVFKRAAHFGYIEFNPITKRKYFFDKEKNDYFVLRDDVEDPYFYASNPNARSLGAKYNSAKSEVARIAQNYPIQGTSSDIVKYACILFFKEVLSRHWWLKVKIVNIVHDEILVECPGEIVQEVQNLLVNCMMEAGKPFCKIVPLGAEAKHGNCWVH